MRLNVTSCPREIDGGRSGVISSNPCIRVLAVFDFMFIRLLMLVAKRVNWHADSVEKFHPIRAEKGEQSNAQLLEGRMEIPLA